MNLPSHMHRYFLELAYMGTNYAGFQTQQNANSVQQEVERALRTYFRAEISCTCSSRTDAGVHALCNYFHFDAEFALSADVSRQAVYHLNALLPADIVVKKIIPVSEGLHARFDAQWREYRYHISRQKDPFHRDRSYFYPYPLDIGRLQAAATLLTGYEDFESFSKRRSQVKHYRCTVHKSKWLEENGLLVYEVRANRFLRGMVKGLVGTMLRVGTGKTTLEEFREIIESRNQLRADFSVPAQGLFLVKVEYGIEELRF